MAPSLMGKVRLAAAQVSVPAREPPGAAESPCLEVRRAGAAVSQALALGVTHHVSLRSLGPGDHLLGFGW